MTAVAVSGRLFPAMERAVAADRWCTPSILPHHHRRGDVYDTDVSVSVGSIGSLLDHTGVFADIEAHAAEVRHADRCWISVSGSTGGNWVVLRSIALAEENPTVLANRAVHHSVVHACRALGIRLRFLPEARFDPGLECLTPPAPDDVAAGLAMHPEASAVLITSPSYEGAFADVAGIATVVHRHGGLLLVDQAWGAHLGFHPALPESACALGADLTVESTHKLGGALQQTGLIHAAGPRVDHHLVDLAYRELTTTSPSYHLVASVDAALAGMTTVGAAAIERSAALIGQLEAAIGDGLPGVVACRRAGSDPMRLTLDVSGTGRSGIAVAEALERSGVIVEKAGLRTLLFLAAFQLGDDASDRAGLSLANVACASNLVREPGPPTRYDPFVDWPATPVFELHEVTRNRGRARRVPLDQAVGACAAETVEVYPPGVPVIIEGYPVTAAACRYLQATVGHGGRVVASDPALASIQVLDPNPARRRN